MRGIRRAEGSRAQRSAQDFLNAPACGMKESMEMPHCNRRGATTRHPSLHPEQMPGKREFFMRAASAYRSGGLCALRLIALACGRGAGSDVAVLLPRPPLKDKLALALAHDVESVVHAIHHRRRLRAAISAVDDQGHAVAVLLVNQFRVGGVL